MTQEYSEKSNEAIEADIHATRQRMDDTLDRLIDRLQPRHLLNDLLNFWQSRRSPKADGQHIAESIRENARKASESAMHQVREVSESLLHQVRENPVPTLLVGAGIAWFIFDRSRSDQERPWSPPPEDLYADEEYEVGLDYDDPIGGTGASTAQHVSGQMAEAREKAGEVAGQARQKLRRTGQHLRERARRGTQQLRARTSHATHEMQDRVRDSYGRAQERIREGYARTQAQLKQTADTHPLATGAACLGLGLLAGFLLPKTACENEWFGDISDTVRDRMKETGQDLVERGKHVAEAATDAVRSEAEHQGLTPERLQESVKAVAREAKASAQHAAEEEGFTAPSEHESSAATGMSESSSKDQSRTPSI
jgi:ElaB/YqjD/DUF883 family membrane-anchored ribosome-binding protein